MSSAIRTASLVLYKNHPALVTQTGEKITIQLPNGKEKKVRDKDVLLLHVGPLQSLDQLSETPDDPQEAWELLQGEQTHLAELAEIAYGDYSPETAWMAWCVLHDGLYFTGGIEQIQVNSPEQVAAEREERARKVREAEAWEIFLQHVRDGSLDKDDRKRLAEVERVALDTAAHSRILNAFNVDAMPEAAHQFLLRCGYWTAFDNPWPRRAGVDMQPVELPTPPMPVDERLDLTHLPAWAIDDEGNQDPDDAISLDGDYLWVHIADVSALITPDSALDGAARARGSNLYLPERVYPMLPDSVTRQLGMGLVKQSPALSIGCRFDGEQVKDIQIALTTVQVQRTTYKKVNDSIEEPHFAAIARITDSYRARRLARNAAQIDLPEVSVKVYDQRVKIRPLPKNLSRDMVTNAMLMAGEAVALYAAEHELAIPHATQPEPEQIQHPQTLSGMYAYRRLFKPSNTGLLAAPHFGLGLPCYARATSPLRRYADLLVHQQLRAHLTGETPLLQDAMAERIASLDMQTGRIRRAERQSNMHWKLVYLQQNPRWRGEAIIVALEERKAAVIIPELALETKIRLRNGMALDAAILLKLDSVDLSSQSAYFMSG